MKLILSIKVISILILGFFLPNEFEKNQILDSQSNKRLTEACKEPIYSTGVLLHSHDEDDCYIMQVSIYATYENGQKLLAHSAMVKSGIDYKGSGKVLSTETYSKKSGPEYIISDDLLNGSIEDFIRDHNKVYQDLVLKKEKVMGIY